MLYSALHFSGKSNFRDFEMESHFLLKTRQNSRLQGRRCIFSRSLIVQVVAFPVAFGAVLNLLATWSSSSEARI